MAIKLPRLNVDITDGKGKPLTVFTRFWDTFATAIEGAIASILSLTTAVGDATAQGLFSVTQGTTSAGALATILLQVRAVTGGVLKAASIKISALAIGSRIEITADDIWLDGTVLSNGAILSAHIGADQVATANIAAAAVTGTEIAGSAVATTHIIADAATIHKVVTAAGPRTPSGGEVNTWITLATLPTFTSTGSPVAISGQFMLHNTDVGSPGTHHYGVRLQRNGATIWPAVAPTYGSDGGSYFNQPIDWVETPGAGSVTYTLDYFPDSTSCDAVNVVLQADEIKR